MVRGIVMARTTVMLFTSCLVCCTLITEAMVDVKWTPSSKKPIRPFSKRYRDANPEPEDEELTKTDSSWNPIANLANTVMKRPYQTTAAVAAGLTTYAALKLRHRIKDGLPLYISRSSPYLTPIEPSKQYMSREFLPAVRRADPTLKLPLSDKALHSFSRKSFRSRVGTGEADYKLAISLMRIWKQMEAADWLSLHWTKDHTRDYLAIVMRTFLGYIVAPMRVHETWSDVETPGASNSTVLSTGALCVSTDGHFLDAAVRFDARWTRPADGQSGDVWFEVTCDSRRGPAALTAAHGYLDRLHGAALEAMCAHLVTLCTSARGMRQLRERSFK